MTLRHGRNCAIYLNGIDISGDLNEINPTSEMELADITVFGNVGHTLYPGLAKDSGTISGLYNSTSQTVINALKQTDPGYAIMIAFGSTAGDPAYCCNEVMLMNHAIKSVVTDVNRISFNFDVDNYPFEPCTMLTAGIYTAGVASTGDGTSINLASASATTGGAGYLQVMSVTGGTLTVHIETSSTGSFVGEEATTCTFAAASSSEAQRVAISSLFYQYARVSWVGATSTASFAVAINKK
jgi:hypothetical protein